MNRFSIVLCCGLVVACSVSLCGNAAEKKAHSPVGQKVEAFSLQDYRGKAYSLDDWKSSKLVVIAFLGTECPLARLYAPRLQSLADTYKAEEVAFVGINANRQDSVTEIAAFARAHNVQFPVLKDVGNKVADQLGAIRTPEVFLLDQNREVQYWGRIDDQYGIGYAREVPQRNDLQLAIDALLADKKPETSANPSVGCHIGRTKEPAADAKVTYSSQISRLLQKHCVECHRAGEIAPFALTEYEEVAGWGEMIAEVVREKRMPPWHASEEHGHFSNARGIPADEKKLILDWVAAGCPQGDPSELPEPVQYTVGWQLPQQPDMVVAMADKPYAVPAEGEVRYQYFTVDPGFTEDKWVRAAECIPGDRSVVHHILVFVRPPNTEGRDWMRGFLCAYVPGFRVEPLPDGMAKRIPAGSKLVFQMHYTPNGTPHDDLSKLGLVFADPAKITHVVKTVEAINTNFKIPANDDNYRVEAASPTYPRNVVLLSMSPHMHLRGKSFSYEARFPDGKRELLLDVPKYDFNWQTTYRLAERRPLPKGTSLFCVAHYDNSENNLNNPDPTASVKWGDQTWEEMMIGFFDVAIPIAELDVKQGKDLDFGPDPQSVARELFERFDTNNDGKITVSEVPGRGKLMFLRLDANKDGMLTLEEVAKVIEERMKNPEQSDFRDRRDGRKRDKKDDSAEKKDDAQPADKKPAEK